jgi:signal peptidase I
MSEQNIESSFEIEEIKKNTKNTFRELTSFFRDIIIILIIVIFIRSFIITPFRINGSSMESNYHDREYILVDKFSYLDFSERYKLTGKETWIDKKILTILSNININIGNPKRWDVIVITPHVDKEREYYVKRVIWLPWEVIRFESGSVFIKKSWAENFIKLNESYLDSKNSWKTYLPEYIEWNQFLVPEWTYWVMGDNRLNSSDSRSCFRNCFGEEVSAHFIKRKDVVGQVYMNFWDINFWYFNIFSTSSFLNSETSLWDHPPRFLAHPRTATYEELK